MLRKAVTSFIRDTSGATAIEYTLIAALVSLTIVAAATLIGNSVENLFSFGGAANIIAEKAATVR
jgi:pilus assembly protein Flp/PilA